MLFSIHASKLEGRNYNAPG